jgi:hypothetical protein
VTVGSAAIGASICGWQTERLDISLVIASAFNGNTISNVNFTGTLGIGIPNSSAVWSAPNNGTLTYTLRFNETFVSGLNTCFAEGFDAAYNFNQLSSPAFPAGVNCRYLGATVEIRGNDNLADQQR